MGGKQWERAPRPLPDSVREALQSQWVAPLARIDAKQAAIACGVACADWPEGSIRFSRQGMVLVDAGLPDAKAKAAMVASGLCMWLASPWDRALGGQTFAGRFAGRFAGQLPNGWHAMAGDDAGVQVIAASPSQALGVAMSVTRNSPLSLDPGRLMLAGTVGPISVDNGRLHVDPRHEAVFDLDAWAMQDADWNRLAWMAAAWTWPLACGLPATPIDPTVKEAWGSRLYAPSSYSQPDAMATRLARLTAQRLADEGVNADIHARGHLAMIGTSLLRIMAGYRPDGSWWHRILVRVDAVHDPWLQTQGEPSRWQTVPEPERDPLKGMPVETIARRIAMYAAACARFMREHPGQVTCRALQSPATSPLGALAA